jgi:hypothetical protein
MTDSSPQNHSNPPSFSGIGRNPGGLLRPLQRASQNAE